MPFTAKEYDDILKYVAAALPTKIYTLFFPYTETEKCFRRLCLILKFQLINYPMKFKLADDSMFIWEYMLTNIDSKTSKTKERIVEVISCLLDEQCYIDIQYIINELHVFEIITDIIENCHNIFYVLDILMYFTAKTVEIVDMKDDVIDIFIKSNMLEIMHNLLDEHEEEWISEYIVAVIKYISMLL